MVEKEKVLEQLRKLKKQIQDDPQVRELYDLDNDGRISGEEWDKARKEVISFMKAREAMERKQSPSPSTETPAAVGGAGLALAGAAGAADHVFQKIKNDTAAPAVSARSGVAGTLFDEPEIIIEQQVEGLELMTDFEGRNSYKFYNSSQRQLGHAEESDTGLAGALTRNIFASKRPFTMGITVFNSPEIIWLKRKFEFIFSRVHVSDEERSLGKVQQRFSLLHRKYELQPDSGGRVLTISGPLFKPWTFYIKNGNQQVGIITKKWSGFLKEAFTRADSFAVRFENPELTVAERKLILGAAIAIDIDYFEQSQK